MNRFILMLIQLEMTIDVAEIGNSRRKITISHAWNAPLVK